MELWINALLAIFAVSWSASAQGFRCPETGFYSSENYHYANPYDCTTFYKCSWPGEIPPLQHCPGDLVFNPTLNVCDWPANYNCLGPCGSLPCRNNGTCTVVGTGYNCTCTPAFQGINCDEPKSPCLAGQTFPCPANLNLYRYPNYDDTDCNSYYLCQYGNVALRDCPASMYFNSFSLRCEAKENKVQWFCDTVRASLLDLLASGI